MTGFQEGLSIQGVLRKQPSLLPSQLLWQVLWEITNGPGRSGVAGFDSWKVDPF